MEESRRLHGSNVLTPSKKESWLRLYLNKFSDPLIVILLVVGVLAVGVSSYEHWALREPFSVFFEPIGIFVAILLATGLAFYFELKAQREFTLLNQVNDREKVTVIRNRNTVEIPKCDVVVGDILVLQTGQEIPADATLLQSVNLSVDESSLTGEPVHEKTSDKKLVDQEATYPSNCVYRGTQIMEGHGLAEVFAVGDHTENGKIMQSIMGIDIDEDQEENPEQAGHLTSRQKLALKLKRKNRVQRKVKTPLNEQLDRLGQLITNISYCFAGAIIVFKLLVYFGWNPFVWILAPVTALFFWLVIKKFHCWSKWMCVFVIIVFFAIFVGLVVFFHDWLLPDVNMSHLMTYALNTVMIAVTLVVVAVPEGLPMAITLALANSMRKMLRTNNLVRKMHACETMGAATVICTDKTGTLTQNQMQVRQTLIANTELIDEAMAVNSTATLDFSDKKPHVIGNPTEGALLLWLNAKGVDYLYMRENVELIDEIPFSTERKYMASLVLSNALPGKKILYVKGSPEILMDMCNNYCDGHTREEYEYTLTQYQNKAMRTLAFACQMVDDDSQAISGGKLVADNLSFMGIVGIEDPIRDDVKHAVGKCLSAGIQVKIITGDASATAREIARQIGIWDESCDDNNCIEGSELSSLTDEELLNRADDIRIIARARPMDKKRFVEALQKKEHIVAVTGDGTNDAPALNAAHVGLSMGAGTNVAKEASDITILDNSFASIVKAVEWGRSLFVNIQRFLLFQLTVNVAACLLVLTGSFMGLESPLTVSQMLWVNLIMDTFAAFALSGLPPTEKVMRDKPRNHRAFILDRDMRRNIFGVGLFFFFLLIGLWYVFHHADITQMTDFFCLSMGGYRAVTAYELTLLFTIFVIAHFWYLFNARAYKSGGSGLNLRGCDGFIIIALIILVGQILIVQVPVLNSFFNVVPISLEDWLLIFLFTLPVMLVREAHACSWNLRQNSV